MENGFKGVKKIGADKAFDDADVPQAAAVAKTLRVALSNLLLYPPESMFIRDSISLAHTNLAPLLSKYGSVTFSEAEGRLLANKKPLSSAGGEDFASSGIVAAFASCNVRSVVFSAGLDAEELTAFIRALGQKKPLDKESAWKHVAFEDKIYIGAGAEDLVVEGGRKYAAGIEAKLSELCKGIESVTAAIAKADEYAELRDREKQSLVRTMSGMEPGPLLDLLVKDLPPEQEKVKYEALKALPPEKMKQMVNLLTARFKESQKVPALAPAAGRAKAGFNKLFEVVKDTAISTDIYNDLVSKGVARELPAKWGAASSRPEELAEKQARALLDKEDASLLDALQQDQLAALIKKLDLYRKPDLIRALLEKLAKNLDSSLPRVRLQTVRTLAVLMPALGTLADSSAVKAIEEKVLAASDMEKDGDVYTGLTGLLAASACRLWRGGYFDKALAILVSLRRHAELPEQDFPKKAECAWKALERISKSDIMPLLMSDLASAAPARLECAVNAVRRLGCSAVPALIGAIKKSDDLRFRKIVSDVIKDAGPEATALLAKALEDAGTAETATRIVNALEETVGGEKMREKLKNMLSHTDPQIRRFSLQVLQKTAGADVSRALMDSARDPDPVVCRESIRLLGERKCGEAIELLIGLISQAAGESEEVQAEACIALGKIGDAEAVRPLTEAALQPGFLSFRKPRPACVRKAAVLALHCFRTETAASALKKLARDNDQEISALAGSARV